MLERQDGHPRPRAGALGSRVDRGGRRARNGCCRNPDGRRPGRHAAQPVAQLLRRRESLRDALLEAAPDHAPELRRQVGAQLDDRRRRVAQDRRDELGRGVAVERPLPRRHLEEDDAEREDVRAQVERPPLHLLGRHVRHGAHDDAFLRLHLGRQPGAVGGGGRGRFHLGQTEVEHLDPPAAAHHDVGRLQIPVDDALLVRRPERVGERGGNLDEPRDRQRSLGDDEVERPALDELHGQEVDAARLLHRVDRHDVRVVQRGHRAGLALESLEPFRARRHLRRQHLESHVAAELRVPRAVHLSHPARADRREDLVGPEAGAGRKCHRVAERLQCPIRKQHPYGERHQERDSFVR